MDYYGEEKKNQKWIYDMIFKRCDAEIPWRHDGELGFSWEIRSGASSQGSGRYESYGSTSLHSDGEQ